MEDLDTLLPSRLQHDWIAGFELGEPTAGLQLANDCTERSTRI
jgi:hypothetical protein